MVIPGSDGGIFGMKCFGLDDKSHLGRDVANLYGLVCSVCSANRGFSSNVLNPIPRGNGNVVRVKKRNELLLTKHG